MGKSTISMAIFNSKLLVYQRVNSHCQHCQIWDFPTLNPQPTLKLTSWVRGWVSHWFYHQILTNHQVLRSQPVINNHLGICLSVWCVHIYIYSTYIYLYKLYCIYKYIYIYIFIYSVYIYIVYIYIYSVYIYSVYIYIYCLCIYI
jgi:hypothetical protein